MFDQVAAHQIGVAREFEPAALVGIGGLDDEALPCGAGIAWKRDTCVLSPVAHALSASSATGAAIVSSFFEMDIYSATFQIRHLLDGYNG